MQCLFCRPRKKYGSRLCLWVVVLLIVFCPVAMPAQMVAFAASTQLRHAFVPANTVNAPAAGGDITNLITADGGNDNIILNGGNYTITLPQNAPLARASIELPAVPTTTYNGVLSGTGTITVLPSSGGGETLLLSNTSTYSLPQAQLQEYADEEPCAPFTYDGVVLHGGDCHSHAIVLHGHNAPVLTINPGATVDFDNARNPGAFAMIRSVVTATTTTVSATHWYNYDNIENNGTIVIANHNSDPTGAVFGEISGSGSLINHIGGFALSGPSTYSGSSVLDSANIDDNTVYGSLPDSRPIYNAFVLSYATPPKTYASAADINSGHPEIDPGYVMVPQDIYESAYGNSIHNISYGTLVLKGVYHYTDSGDPLHPSLSNPALDYADCRGGNPSDRRLFLGHAAGVTQLGDGTTAQIFLPASVKNGYIWLDKAQSLSFDYNGTVTLDVPINRPDGGGYFIPGARPGNVFVLGTPGNHVIFTQPEYYNGLTKIDTNAILQLGDGTPGNDNPNFVYTNPAGVTYRCDYSTSSGNGSLTTAESPGGAATDQIIDNGQLIVDNVPNALDGAGNISLSNISGSGSLLQEGSATLTLLENTAYTGATTIAHGTLALGTNSSLATSSGIALTNSGATFDISQAGNQTVSNISGVGGSRIFLGSHVLTVGTATSTTFGGTIADGGIGRGTGGGFRKVGSGTLTLTGATATQNGNCQLQQGVLQLGNAATSQATLQCAVSLFAGAKLSGNGTINGNVMNAGIVESGVPGVDSMGTLTINGNYTQTVQSAGLAIHIDGTRYNQLKVNGNVTLGGKLTVTLGTKPELGQALTIIKNTDSSPVSGMFAGLPEGAKFTVDGVPFRISYTGGSGKDVVLSTGDSIVSTSQSSSSSGTGTQQGSGSFPIGMLIGILALLVIGGLLIFILLRRRHRQRHIDSLPT